MREQEQITKVILKRVKKTLLSQSKHIPSNLKEMIMNKVKLKYTTNHQIISQLKERYVPHKSNRYGVTRGELNE
jgi:hypothetical protein